MSARRGRLAILRWAMVCRLPWDRGPEGARRLNVVAGGGGAAWRGRRAVTGPWPSQERRSQAAGVWACRTATSAAHGAVLERRTCSVDGMSNGSVAWQVERWMSSVAVFGRVEGGGGDGGVRSAPRAGGGS